MNSEEKRGIRWWFWMIALGAACGGIVTSLLGAKVLAYWFEPPVSVGISCRAPIEWALSRLQRLQMVGTALGATFGLLGYLVFRPKKKEVIEPTQF